MIKNRNYVCMLLITYIFSCIPMDQPPAHKSKAADEPEKNMPAKKRAPYGSKKQFGTRISDIKIVQPGITRSAQIVQPEETPLEQQELDQVKVRLSGVLTGIPLSTFDYEIINKTLRELTESHYTNIKAEAYLLLGHLNLNGWGQPQNIRVAYQYYNAAAKLNTPISDIFKYYKAISFILQQIEDTLLKKSLSFNQKLQEIQKFLQKSPYQADELLNKLILNLIKKMYPESNTVENALTIASPVTQIIEQLVTSNTEYRNDAVTLIKLALFANNTTLLKNIYNYAPILKNIMEQLLAVAIENNQYHDIEMFIKAGVDKEQALTLAHRLGKSEVIQWLNAQPLMTPAAAIHRPAHSEIQSTFSTVPPKVSALPAPTIQIQPNIPVNDQFITAIKQRKSTAELEVLLQAGAEINYIDEFQNNPLIEAIQNKDAHLVKWLLERGADSLLVVYDDGNLQVTPDYAARLEENADVEIIQLIEDAQINKLKVLSSPIKPAAVPASSPRKAVPFKGFQEKQ